MATAFGFVETRGFVGAAEANDALHKAANVSLAHRADIGGGFITTVCRGDVGATRAAVAAGERAAREAGDFYAAHVIPNLHRQVIERVFRPAAPEALDENQRALGLIECQGFTPLSEAADAAVKAANVEIVDSCWVGAGYAAVMFRGDVAACRAATEAGAASAQRLGRVLSGHVIAAPHPLLFTTLHLGPLPKTKQEAEQPEGFALGFIETKGYVGMVEAADAAVKVARVAPVGWQRVGSALVTIVVQGEVAAVRSAVAAGIAGAQRAGESVAGHVIPRPHEAMDPFMDSEEI